MDDRELELLLKNADAGGIDRTASGVGSRSLSERIVRRYQHQQFVKRAAFAATGMALLVAASFAWLNRQGNQQAHDLSNVENVKPEEGVVSKDNEASEFDIAAAARDASQTSEMVHRVLETKGQLDRIAALERELASLEGSDPVEQRVHATAAISLVHGDRQLTLGMQPSAAGTYQRIVELFPYTPSAGLAQRRLSEMQMN